MFTDVIPNGEKDTLSFVVTRAVGMRLTKVSRHDRTIDGADNVRQADLLGGMGQDIAASHPTFRSHQTCAFEGEENLFEVWLGESGAFSNVAH